MLTSTRIWPLRVKTYSLRPLCETGFSVVLQLFLVKRNRNAVLFRTFQFLLAFLLQSKELIWYLVAFAMQSRIGFSDFLPQDNYLFITLHCMCVSRVEVLLEIVYVGPPLKNVGTLSLVSHYQELRQELKIHSAGGGLV